MGIGRELRDRLGFGEYVRERLLPLAPPAEPIPFRGRLRGGEEVVGFVEEMEEHLRAHAGAVWTVAGPSGFGETLLGRWAAAGWGRRFLEEPETSPLPIWIEFPAPARARA